MNIATTLNKKDVAMQFKQALKHFHFLATEKIRYKISNVIAAVGLQ